MSRRFAAVVTSVLGACGGTNVSVEFTFPDPDSRELTTALQVTAVEPFVPAPSGSDRTRLLLKCGQLGVFGPTAKVNRDQADLPDLNVLVQREGRDLPLEDDWALDLERFKSSEETNPWRAVMVHFEARGNARKSEGGLAPADEVKTLLEGCFCMRLNETATYAEDPKLDEEVKANCPAIDSTPRPVSLAPVTTEQFFLAPCGVRAVTAPKGRQAVALPGVCVRTNTCKDAPGPNCFPCATDQCGELDDLKNVPIRVKVQQAAGTAAPDPKIILTNRFGSVVPQAQVDDCASPITIEASIVGSAATPISFPVTCVDPVDFSARPTDSVDLATDLQSGQVAAITTIPEVRSPGGGLVSPARVAVIINATENRSSLEIYEANGRRLELAASLRLSPNNGVNERGFGLLGFHYRLADKTNPVLAVVTSRANVPVVRIYRYDETAVDRERRLVLLRETARQCAYDACAQMRECPGPNRPGPCAQALVLESAMPPLSMAVSDRNGDGLADFTVATDREFQVLTYYSHPSSPDMPPELDRTCECSAYGRGMPAFDFVRLGGTPLSSDPDARNVDLLMGDGTGAYVRYAAEPRIEAQPCSVSTSSAAYPCPAGLTCVELCANSPASARCVEPCVYEDAGKCSTSPDRPDCVTFDVRVQPSGSVVPTGPGYCGRPSLGCRAPSSVWRLVTIHDVARANIRSADFQDAIAVGAGSPVPSSASGGLVRIMYGGSLDLTNVSSLEARLREESSVELAARRLQGAEDAQSPRGVEIGDINGDGRDDIAAIYTSSEEIRVWLGGGNAVPGEIGRAPGVDEGGRVKLNECGAMCPGRLRCFPFQRFAVADLDGDGKAEISAVCVPDVDGPRPVLKWFAPEIP